MSNACLLFAALTGAKRKDHAVSSHCRPFVGTYAHAALLLLNSKYFVCGATLALVTVLFKGMFLIIHIGLLTFEILLEISAALSFTRLSGNWVSVVLRNVLHTVLVIYLLLFLAHVDVQHTLLFPVVAVLTLLNTALVHVIFLGNALFLLLARDIIR